MGATAVKGIPRMCWTAVILIIKKRVRTSLLSKIQVSVEGENCTILLLNSSEGRGNSYERFIYQMVGLRLLEMS